jgi:hypothetical protein
MIRGTLGLCAMGILLSLSACASDPVAAHPKTPATSKDHPSGDARAPAAPPPLGYEPDAPEDPTPNRHTVVIGQDNPDPDYEYDGARSSGTEPPREDPHALHDPTYTGAVYHKGVYGRPHLVTPANQPPPSPSP